MLDQLQPWQGDPTEQIATALAAYNQTEHRMATGNLVIPARARERIELAHMMKTKKAKMQMQRKRRSTPRATTDQEQFDRMRDMARRIPLRR